MNRKKQNLPEKLVRKNWGGEGDPRRFEWGGEHLGVEVGQFRLMLSYLCKFVSFAGDTSQNVHETFDLLHLLQFKYKLLANLGYLEIQNRKRFSKRRSYLCIKIEPTLAHIVS